ncbi:MAG: hypothetical protein OIN66_01115 [Candidatus Methanoperedens sp.]|nr:hypothetical protein [Candidatus Methanoperedens sp.]
MYKSGYSVNIFKILERDVIDFLNYIPIDYYIDSKRKNIYSPRLAELLIRIGSQIDTFFRNWVIVHEIYNKKNKKQLNDVYDLKFSNFKDIESDKKVILSNKEIKIIATDEIITPFLYWTDKRYPLWWDAYNKVKHNGFIYKSDGNLLNVIESLSALFLLNCIHNETEIILLEEQIRKRGIRGIDSKGKILGNIRSELFEFRR